MLVQSLRKIYCCYLSLLTEHLGTGGEQGHSSKCNGKIIHSAEPHVSRGAEQGRGDCTSRVPPSDPQTIFSSALKTDACFKMSIAEKLNTANHHSEPSYHLASGCDDMKRGGQDWGGMSRRGTRLSPRRSAPAAAWDGRRVAAPARGLLCNGRKEQQAVNLTEWKEQTP